MAWCIKEIKAAIAIQVYSLVLTQLQPFPFVVEVDFSQGATFPGLPIDGAVIDSRIARTECVLEPWSDDKICRP
jgi:hypothetical protein